MRREPDGRAGPHFLVTLRVEAVAGAKDLPRFQQDSIVLGQRPGGLLPRADRRRPPLARIYAAVAVMLAGFVAPLSMYMAGAVVHGSLDRDPILVGLAVSFLAARAATVLSPPPAALVRRSFHAG